MGPVQQGWDVLGSDGNRIGEVAGASEDTLVVRAGLLTKHELYVPISYVERIDGDRVVLSVSSGDAGSMGWTQPPGSGTAAPSPANLESGASDMTTMTGAGYGAGGGASAGGAFSPTSGDARTERLGGSGRAGLSDLGASERGPDSERQTEEGPPAAAPER